MKYIFLIISATLLGLLNCDANTIGNSMTDNTTSTANQCKYMEMTANCGELQLNVSTTQYEHAHKDVSEYLSANNGREISSDSALGIIVVNFADSHSEKKLSHHKKTLESLISVNKALYVMPSVMDK